MRAVTWPDASNSEATRITTAGEVATRIAATAAATLGSVPK